MTLYQNRGSLEDLDHVLGHGWVCFGITPQLHFLHYEVRVDLWVIVTMNTQCIAG